jgi:protein TonB
VEVQGLQVLRSVKPSYPADCRRRGEEGTATLLLEVRGGAVKEVRMERSSGHEGLDRAAVAALRKWKFNASLEALVRVPVVFRLE